MAPNIFPSNIRPLSLRDPSGTLFEVDSQLIRQIHPQGKSNWESVKNSQTLKELIEKGSLVRTWEINDPDPELVRALPKPQDTLMAPQQDLYLGHDKISFVSYPYEWPPEMLKEAGLLTLDLAIELSKENLGLKDATPFNVLFTGCNPIFVDLLSIEKRNPKDSLWVAYSQFSKTFINPLLAYKYWGQSLQKIFLISREGLTATDLYSQSSFFKKLSPSLFTQITLPAILENWSDRKLSNHPKNQKLIEENRAKFTFNFFLKSVRKSFAKLNIDSDNQRTQFKHYMGTESPYSAEQFLAKEQFVKGWLQKYSKSSVLDLGCNDGHFSRIAASLGRRVVAVDSEIELVSKTWKLSRQSHPKILPLVINIANPSPASGWKSKEYKSFLERAHGEFDCVLMLALVHHLLTTESILLPHILELAKELTANHIILEWVSTSDPMFNHLSKGRDYSHLTQETFEKECSKHFTLLEKQELPGKTRTLYCLKKI